MKIFSDINLDDLSEEDMSDLATITAKIRNLLISEDDYKKMSEKALDEFINDRFHLVSIFPTDIKIKNYKIAKENKVKILILLNKITDELTEVLKFF